MARLRPRHILRWSSWAVAEFVANATVSAVWLPPSFRCGAFRARLAAAVLATAMLAGTAQAADPPQPNTGATGKPVIVTAEMRGAGMVSSGVVLPPPPPATGTRARPVPSWVKPLPFPIVIGDRRNNRLIEVAPDKRIIWQYGHTDTTGHAPDYLWNPDGLDLDVYHDWKATLAGAH